MNYWHPESHLSCYTRRLFPSCINIQISRWIQSSSGMWSKAQVTWRGIHRCLVVEWMIGRWFCGGKNYMTSRTFGHLPLCWHATGWGIGLILNRKWLAWQLKDGWNTENCEIGWAEMVAVELAIYTLISVHLIKCHIIVWSDNIVIGALKTDRLQETQQNLILRKIVELIQENKLWISTAWISMSNNPVDLPLRGIFPGRESLFAFPLKLPFYLTNFVHGPVTYHDPRLHWIFQTLYVLFWMGMSIPIVVKCDINYKGWLASICTLPHILNSNISIKVHVQFFFSRIQWNTRTISNFLKI
jgi:hypothetical protein